MSARLKTLQEQRGAKVKELDAILAPARKENRALSADEGTRFDSIDTEVKALDIDIQREMRGIAIASSKPVQLSAGETAAVDRFDLGVALRSLVNGTRLEGVEAELLTEGQKEFSEAVGLTVRGLALPRMLVRRQSYESRAGNPLSATGTTSVTGDQGGMTIATQKAGLLDDFYNASVLRSAGATVLEGLVGNLDVPRILQATAPAKKGENASADAANQTTSMLSLKPKRLPAYIDIGEQLLRQSSSAIEQVVRRNLLMQLLGIQEIAFFHGGGTNEANGIAAQLSGNFLLALGTNGANPTFANLVSLESRVDQANALLGVPKYFINAKVRAQLKTTLKNPSGTDSGFVISDLRPGTINGYDFAATNAVSSTLTKGTANGTCSATFFGNPADYWIGYWGGLTLELLRDSSNAITGQYRLAAATYYDGGVVRQQSFSGILDALTPNA